MEIECPDLETIIQYFYFHLFIVLYTIICLDFLFFPSFFCSSTLLASPTPFWESSFSGNISFRMSFRTYVDGKYSHFYLSEIIYISVLVIDDR